ncbi:hypothetical protein C8R47DRAFT_1132643 [Mycena vitilis]|nr:hypothetical protein C8R47DRAFT_1132643 [Mycena vitilis]
MRARRFTRISGRRWRLLIKAQVVPVWRLTACHIGDHVTLPTLLDFDAVRRVRTQQHSTHGSHPPGLQVHRQMAS